MTDNIKTITVEQDLNILKELKSIILSIDLIEMMKNYQNMVNQWARVVNLKLNNDYIKCPITLGNEVMIIKNNLEAIDAYQKHIEFCAVLQGTLDSHN